MNHLLNQVPKRVYLVLLCSAALFLAYTDRVNLSVAILAMQEEFQWTETTKGLIMSAFFVGYLIFQIPCAWLANRYGGKRILGVAVLWWSVFTLLTPLAALISLPALIMSRIALGLGEAAAFPATYAMFSRWIPGDERSRAISTVTGGVILGTLFALLITGIIVSYAGWEMAFYFFGVLGLVWAVFWFRSVFESPEDHPGISNSELALIKGNKPLRNGVNTSVPWRKIFTTPSVWALILNHFCVNWTLYVLLAWLPSYFAKTQGVSLAQSGFYSIAPWIAMFVMVTLTGWSSDFLIKRYGNTILIRKSVQILGLLGAASFLLLSRNAESAMHAVLLLSLAMGSLGLCYSGFGPNHLEIAPRHADIVFGITNTFATIPGIIGIAITGWLVDLSGTYSAALLLAASLNILGAFIWLIFSAHQPILK